MQNIIIGLILLLIIFLCGFAYSNVSTLDYGDLAIWVLKLYLFIIIIFVVGVSLLIGKYIL